MTKRHTSSKSRQVKNLPLTKGRTRTVLVLSNLLLFLVVTAVIIRFSGGNVQTYSIGGYTEQSVNPLDEVSATDIAVNVAQLSHLPETNSVINYSDTINSEIDTYRAGTSIAKLPMIISSDNKTLADIVEYTTKNGDTVSLLAEKFGITSDSIKWSNDLTSDSLPADTKLLIPPMNGMIYIIRSGDTPDKVASLYHISRQQIIVFNDLEVGPMIPGRRIFLPNAQKSSSDQNFAVRYGYNGYDAGWCTYYAAARGGAPMGWGNARTWAVNAVRTSGWYVSKTPVPGAIAQTTGIEGDRVGGSWGHVGIVEQVKEIDGQVYIKYSDMNGLAGFNRVGHSDWVPALSKFQNFIYRIE